MLLYAEKYLSTVVFHLLYKVDSTHCGSADGLCSVLLVSYLSLHQYHIASISCYVVVVQLLSHVHLFVTPWTVAHQAFLSITISQSLLRFMSFELVLLSNCLILCHPLLLLSSTFPSIRVFFPVSQLFASGGQSIGASASVSVPLVNIQG